MSLPSLTPQFGSTLILIAVFYGLLAQSVRREGMRAWLRKRALGDWVLDSTGLLIQGWMIPIFQTVLSTQVWGLLWPQGQRLLDIPPLLTFLIGFVAVDYAYYWNHRLLHSRYLWSQHETHHSTRTLDVLASSRNTLWSSFLLVHLWLNGFLLYITAQPTAVLASVTLNAALDLWRHSGLTEEGIFTQALKSAFITPRDHAWHHSQEEIHANFGGNLKIWDKIHGTYRSPARDPSAFGVASPKPFLQQLLRPFI